MKKNYLLTVELDDAARMSAPEASLRFEIAAFTAALVEFHTPLQERLFKPRVTVTPLDGYQAAILTPTPCPSQEGN